MNKASDAILLRVFVGEDDLYRGRSLYRAIVVKALEAKMAGATVLRGPEGFGPTRHIRSEMTIDAGPRLPMVVEIVDSEERINGFLPIIQELVETGLITFEKVRAIYYRRQAPEGKYA